MIPTTVVDDGRAAATAAATTGGGLGLPPNADPNTIAAWRESERRQRSVRMLMMFLLMLLLMDSEEQSSPRQKEFLRKRKAKPLGMLTTVMSEKVYSARREQDEHLSKLTATHPRFLDLMKLNGDQNVEAYIQNLALQRVLKEEEADDEEEEAEEEEGQDADQQTKTKEKEAKADFEKKVFHYPWNTTGFYRGEWIRQDDSEEEEESDTTQKLPEYNHVTPADMEPILRKSMKERQEVAAAVMLLPQHTKFQLPENYTYSQMEETALEVIQATSARSSQKHKGAFFRLPTPELNVVVEDAEEPEPQLSLTKTFGRAAFQFYSRSVPGMETLSVVDGFVKLYDSNTVGYSTRRDILLRVKGVLLHSIGRLSLVSNTAPGRSAFIMASDPSKTKFKKKTPAEDEPTLQPQPQPSKTEQRRLLQDLIGQVSIDDDGDDEAMSEVRDQTLLAYPFDVIRDKGYGWSIISSSKVEEQVNQAFQLDRSGWLFDMIETYISSRFRDSPNQHSPHRRLTNRPIDAAAASSVNASQQNETTYFTNSTTGENNTLDQSNSSSPDADLTTESAEELEAMFTNSTNETLIGRRMVEGKKSKRKREGKSKFVFRYPYVQDDESNSIRKAKTPAARNMPTREQVLEGNAGRCEFELNLDVKETEWTVLKWKTMVEHYLRDIRSLDPRKRRGLDEADESELSHSKTKHAGTLELPKKNQMSKFLVEQALVMNMAGWIRSPNCEFSALLNATAIRTDWQNTTDKAIHYSFYMMLTCLTQIVVLLRQLLHTQHHSGATRVSLLCIGWQAVLDALLCLSHIYLSLAMQPLFTAFASVAFFKLLIFCVIEMKYMAIIIQARNNANGGQSTAELLRRQIAILHLRFYVALIVAFLAFFYATQQYRTLYMLALYSFWVPQIVYNVITETKRPLHVYYIYGISVTRLVVPLYIFAIPNNFLKEVFPDAPTNYFMIEVLFLWLALQTAVLIGQSKYGARFMIPARFLPPKYDYHRAIPATLIPPEALEPQPETTLETSNPASTNSDNPSTGVKNRLKGGRQEQNLITTINEPPDKSPTLDCVICCSEVEIRNRKGYMLPPCNHIFHKECLVPWMDVKMECPVCRTELPAL